MIKDTNINDNLKINSDLLNKKIGKNTFIKLYNKIN